MVNNEYTMNGMLVFSRPIQINNHSIYGLIYDTKVEEYNTKMGNKLSTYIAYLVGVEYFLKNGGTISPDGHLWTLPDGIHTLECNISVYRFLDVMMKGIVDFLTFEFDEPIVWNEGEVDIDGNMVHLILSEDLMNRYIILEDE